MEFVLASCTGVASVGYIIRNISRYKSFKKFVTVGYINDCYLLDGKVTSANSINSLIYEHKNGQHQEKILIKTLHVKIGKEKIDKMIIMIPQNYNYTDWKTTYDKMSMVENSELVMNGKTKLILKDFVPYYVHSHTIKETAHHKLDNLLTLFDKYGIEYKNGEKVKVLESFIQNGEDVSVFGKYTPDKQMQVQYIGNKEKIVEAVRKNVCNLNYGSLVLAGCVFVGSIAFLISNIIKQNEHSYSSKT